jgi:predicted peptidase
MQELVILLAVVLFMGMPSHSQTATDFKSGTHTYGGTTLPFRLFIPKNYQASKKFPLVLFLHGAGERGSDNSKPVSDNLGAQIFARDSNQTKHPAFILAPQCPAAPNQWVDVPWGNGTYSIDTNRIYAVGSSMGGFGPITATRTLLFPLLARGT